ncbi:hypothetical protein SAMN04488067_102139 [Halorubrum xinjiangense]|uniref:Uncharacterized protein n=1 Tax=Halorubrum xinjiangense TaxID=261291 RepID=A0A1G7IQA7_9EURY|nr:hypothetical protein [Halorubrum xinjiangense]SDF14942.1 hypothetical protein SAMN04488067_102139 [Halorubrum xinjiangense]
MERRKFVIGAGSLAAGGAAAMGTGAFSAAQISGRKANIQVSDDSEALLQLIPGHEFTDGDGTVSSDRVFYQDGQLSITFDDSGGGADGSGTGIAPNSVYQVGAISQGFDDIDYWADDDDDGDPSLTDDVLYGDLVDDDEPTESGDPAFVVRNESDETYSDIVIAWEGESAPDRDKATAAMNVRGGGAGTSVFSLEISGGTDHASFELAPGEAVYASLIASTGDFDPENTDSWIGELVINAGNTDRFEEPTTDA